MLYAIVAVIAIILDQVVKYLVETHVVLNAVGGDLVKLIPGVIHITNVHNIGGAFNMLQGARWLFIVVCILFVAVVIFVLARGIIKTPLARWMAVFVLAGAIGHCIDRVICGYVVDMFELEFFRFPVFNLADIFITLGAIIFCLCVLFEKPKAETEEPTPEQIVGEQSDALPAEAKPQKRARREKPAYPAAILANETPVDPSDPFAEWEGKDSPAKPADPADAAPQTPLVAPVRSGDGPDTAELVWKDDEPAKETSQPVWPVLRGPDSEPVADDDVKPFKLHIITDPVRDKPEKTPEIPVIRVPEAEQKSAAPVRIEPEAAATAAKPAAAPVSKPAPAPAETPAVNKPAAPVVTEEDPENVTYNIDDILAEFLDT